MLLFMKNQIPSFSLNINIESSQALYILFKMLVFDVSMTCLILSVSVCLFSLLALPCFLGACSTLELILNNNQSVFSPKKKKCLPANVRAIIYF